MPEGDLLVVGWWWAGGGLVVDAPELLRLAADQLATIELVGGTVKVKYRAIWLLVGDLREQYVTGSLVIKISGATGLH